MSTVIGSVVPFNENAVSVSVTVRTQPLIGGDPAEALGELNIFLVFNLSIGEGKCK